MKYCTVPAFIFNLEIPFILKTKNYLINFKLFMIFKDFTKSQYIVRADNYCPCAEQTS